MQHWKSFAVTIAFVASFAATAQPADQTAKPDATKPGVEQAEAAPKCLKAVVNPVTGHAICIEPKGAPVDPPERSALQRPCPPRAHDDDPFTVYEHWSGCH